MRVIQIGEELKANTFNCAEAESHMLDSLKNNYFKAVDAIEDCGSPICTGSLLGFPSKTNIFLQELAT